MVTKGRPWASSRPAPRHVSNQDRVLEVPARAFAPAFDASQFLV
jgi:hypothetical protein